MYSSLSMAASVRVVGSVSAGRIILQPGASVCFSSSDVTAGQLIFSPDSAACFGAGSDIAVNSIQVKRSADSGVLGALGSLFASAGFGDIFNIDISHLTFPEGAFSIRVDSNYVVSMIGEDTDPFLGTDTDLFV